MRALLLCCLSVFLLGASACPGPQGARSASRPVTAPPAPAPTPAALPAEQRPAGPRVALVLGNGAYLHTSPLRNPPGDATAIAQALRGLGFDTEVLVDQGRLGIERGLRDFARRATGAELALLFYAGHGLQAGARNYLVPTDAQLAHDADIPYETIDVQNLLEDLQARARIGVIFLDACRDNPLSRSLPATTRALGRGLSPIEVQGGELLLVYATSPGRTAEDGRGQHSPFTQALLRHLSAPQLEVQIMLKRVIRDVEQLTSGQQVPWQASTLRSEVYLNGGAIPAGPSAPPTPSAPPPGESGEMAQIPGGTVRVDLSHDGERTGQHKVDGPQTRSEIVAPFLLDRKEVSVEDYAACAAAGGCQRIRFDLDEICNRTADRRRHPQNCVTWQQAQAYCTWAGKRLPTEFEWTLAAHGTGGRLYPWGELPLPKADACWLRGNAGTCEVGSAPQDRSPEGVLDLGGNVSEWTSSPSPCCFRDATGDHQACGAAAEYIYMGASYGTRVPTLWRLHYQAGIYSPILGFRCARDR